MNLPGIGRLLTGLLLAGAARGAFADPVPGPAGGAGFAGAEGTRATAPAVDRGCLVLGFDRLAGYPFAAPDPDPSAPPGARPPTGEEQIPPTVKAWDGKRAVITGFMLPIRIENGRAVEFLLMANQMACCYGLTPAMNQWVLVRIPGGTAAIQDVPISFRGILKVGAVVENGCLAGIYSLTAEGEGEVSQN